MGKYPTISALDTNVKCALTIRVPFATAEGVSAGAADLHHGNNVHLIAVALSLTGERDVFQIESSKG